jgi:CheY-like chemotaxis protein/two-component sensor histidine kinase
MDELREADRRKDDFIATLAHELRNPLAPIRNAAAVMRFATDLSPKLQWCRDVIDRQVAHMAALLDDLLDVSRLARDKITLRRDRVEVGTAIAQAVEINRHLIEGRGHRLTMHLTQQPLEVEGDLTRLIQIFGNLLNNAAKYTEPEGEIDIRTALAGDQVIIRVRDNGIGIRPDNLRTIFDLFAQVDPSRGGPEGGLGIGLALVKGLVERHGGSIVARSEGLGRGSEFIICLPLARTTREAKREENPELLDANGAATPLRVLVADDNVDAADSLAMILQADHHQVRTAHDGEEALELAAQQKPDVMLVDLGMPRLNGYELARRVRGEPWGRDTVLIACTGWGQPEDRRRTEESGFDYHLVKPVSPTAVLRLLQSLDLMRSR